MTGPIDPTRTNTYQPLDPNIANLQGNVTDLQNQLNGFNQDATNLTTEQMQLNLVEMDASNKIIQCQQKLTTANENFQTANGNLQAANAAMTQALSIPVQTIQNPDGTYTEDSSARDSAIQEAQAKIDAAQREVDDAQKAVDDAQAELDDAEAEHDRIQADIDAYQTELDDLNEKKGTTQTELEAARRELQQAQDNMINDESFYLDDANFEHGMDAVKYLQQSSLFNRRLIDGAQAIDKFVNNDKWQIEMDVDGDGEMDSVSLAEATAASFDSELDLYIMQEVENVINEFGPCAKSYLSEKAVAKLKEKGIVAEAIDETNRVYAFSLVDENGNVLEDENGHKGSCIFSDSLIPDGHAQGAEINLSSILDQMGYDCISKADFVGREEEYYDTLKKVEANIQNGMYSATEGTDSIYGYRKENITKAVHDLFSGRSGGGAPGMWGAAHGGSVDGSLDSYGSAYEQMLEELMENRELREKTEDIQKYYQEQVDKGIEKYKRENNGEEPTNNDMADISREAALNTKVKFGTAASTTQLE